MCLSFNGHSTRIPFILGNAGTKLQDSALIRRDARNASTKDWDRPWIAGRTRNLGTNRRDSSSM